MRLEKFIDEAGKSAIEGAVTEAEKHTSGEIVPMIVASSSSYDWIGYRASLLGWLAASFASFFIHYRYPFAFEFWSIFAIQACGIALGWFFSRSSLGFRFLVSSAAISEEVLEAAQSAFLKHGLMNTRDRTGVLIFVSLKEHRVQILGDKGIHEKVGEAFWKHEAEMIVASIRAGKPGEGLAHAIQRIGEKLKTHFPRRVGDTNELADQLRTER